MPPFIKCWCPHRVFFFISLASTCSNMVPRPDYGPPRDYEKVRVKTLVEGSRGGTAV